MNKEKVILGLDIGVGSVGWGLVKLAEEKYVVENQDGTAAEKYKITGGEILDAGIRTFQLPQDRQGESLAIHRGAARRSRWTIRRKAKRLKQLTKLAREFNLIGDNFNRDEILKPKKGNNKKEKWDIWRIRKEALERKLTDDEFFRVLYHIAKHRGFHFHTKAEFLPEEDKGKLKNKGREPETSEKDKEEEKVKQGLQRIRGMLKDSGYKTVGKMFWDIFKQTNADNKRKRNAKDKYANSIHRELLRDEIVEIFKSQQKLGNSKAKDEFKQRYIVEILMHEEGIDDEKLKKMMRPCEFTGKLCAPREGYTAERFTLFNRLNTLELVDTQNKNRHLSLDDTQRGKIVALAYKNSKVTFAQTREELGYTDKLHIRFNLCSYSEKNPEYNKKLECDVKGGELQFEDKHKVPIVNISTGEITSLGEKTNEIFRRRKETWKNAKTLYVYYSDIRKQMNLSGDFRFAGLKGYTKSAAELGGEANYMKQFEEDDTFVELKGYHKIRKAIEGKCSNGKWEQLRGDIEKLDTIAEALTYCKSDETRAEYLRQHNIVDNNIIEAVLTLNMKQLATYSKEALGGLLKYMDNKKEWMLFNDAKEKCGYGKTEYKKQTKLEPYSGPFEKNPAVARAISQTRKLVNAIVLKHNSRTPIDQIHIEVATELANSKKRKNDIAQGQKRYQEDKKRAEERCKEFNIDPEEGQNLLMFRLAEQQNNKCPYTGKAITFYPAAANNEVNIQDCEIDHVIPMSRSFNDSLNNKILCAPEANQNKRDRIPFEWFEDTYGKDSQQWSDFENAVKKMYGVPYPKRKNLLRKSWTDDDKEKFLDRNLNDTRYATRHIADYLRKYFDFSKSQRDDIKDVSRIQLRSGGITAFLRHMWGLNKNREESDRHHALDALVVACSTYGHVYLVSNLSKEIERKGKNWYKHFGRDKFKPWGNIREDVKKTVDNIFISRMPRHKVTAEAHKDTIASLKEMPTTKRVIRVNGGYAEMGGIVRTDIFTDKNGKYYAVPIYATDIFAKKPLPDKYVPDDRLLPYEKWSSVSNNALEFKFSLFKDDLIGINDKMFYVSFFEATTANVNVKNVDGSIFSGKKDAQDPYTKKIAYRPKSKTKKCVLKKYYVDMLGKYTEVIQEKRPGKFIKKTAK